MFPRGLVQRVIRLHCSCREHLEICELNKPHRGMLLGFDVDDPL